MGPNLGPFSFRAATAQGSPYPYQKSDLLKPCRSIRYARLTQANPLLLFHLRELR